MPRGAAKNWCWTLNNPTDHEKNYLTALGSELPEPLLYLVFGRETGEGGTPHLQGYLSLSQRKGLAWVKNTIGDRIHAEVQRGTNQQASDYCKKDGDFDEYGELPQGQGKRSDLIDCVAAIKQGKNMRELADEFPSVVLRYGSGVLRLRQFSRPSRTSPPEIKVFWGPTGTGKTRRVWEFADHEKLWVHPGNQWFDGYDQHPAVLFDDFEGSWFKLSYLLKLLDRYVFQVPVKVGGSRFRALARRLCRPLTRTIPFMWCRCYTNTKHRATSSGGVQRLFISRATYNPQNGTQTPMRTIGRLYYDALTSSAISSTALKPAT